jgi:Asp-tRNA(Asn)/Glu-tRNA(Gln) amidotransferase A subunit family amidase
MMFNLKQQPALLLLLFAIVMALVVVLTDRHPESNSTARSSVIAPGVAAPTSLGSELVVSDCSGCHPQTRAQWAQTMAQMEQIGAQVNPQDAPVLLDYLARRFGPSQP